MSAIIERMFYNDGCNQYTSAAMKEARMCAGTAVLNADCQLDASVHVSYMSERVAAGFPSPADDYHDGVIDLNRHLVAHPAATFVVRVAGWSMRDAGIYPGDELIVDKSYDAHDGDVVVVVVDGEFTVKRLRLTAQGVVLQAENPDYPHIIPGERDWMVWGVVTCVLHRP